MKTFLVLAALVFLPGAACLHADPLTVSLKTGAATDTLTTTAILNGFQYTYQNITTGQIPGTPPIDVASNSDFLATYVVTGGLGVLTVTDNCGKVNAPVPLGPCQQFSFSFSDGAFGTATVISSILATDITISGNTANFFIPGGNILVTGDVASAGGEVDFSSPLSPVPEPASLCLVATGLLGAAVQLRKRQRP